MPKPNLPRYFAITDWEDVIDIGYHADFNSADEAAKKLETSVIWLMPQEALEAFIKAGLAAIHGDNHATDVLRN